MCCRLRQVDASGQATYSPVRTVQVLPAAGLLVRAHPNASALTAKITLWPRTDLAGEAQRLLTRCRGSAVGAGW